MNNTDKNLIRLYQCQKCRSLSYIEGLGRRLNINTYEWENYCKVCNGNVKEIKYSDN